MKIPDWLAAARARSPGRDSIEWDALRTANELFDRNRDGLMTGEAFNADVTPMIELVHLVREITIDECAAVSEPESAKIADAIRALKQDKPDG